MSKRNSIWEFEPDSVVHRITEVKAFKRQGQAELKQQFQGLEELVFRHELSVLLDERHASRTVEIVGLMKDQKLFALDMPFIRQNEDFICGEIQKRLASAASSKRIFVDKELIKQYLRNVDEVFRTKLANGEEVTAIPYVGTIFHTREPKQGRARPVVIFDTLYPTIEAASRANPGLSYDSIRMASMRSIKKLMNK